MVTEVEKGTKGKSRKFFHLLNSGCITVGIEHLLVMFPSALLIAKYANTPKGPIITLPMVLFSCGVATLLFSFFGKPKVPFFLGPSISYIGFLSHQAAMLEISEIDQTYTQISYINYIRITVFLGYLMASIILLALSFAYKNNRFRECMSALIPYTVMGPAISLIGLQVVDTAVADSGFNGTDTINIFLALVTLICIIVVSLTGIRLFQNASVLFGVLVGCVIAASIHRLDLSSFYFEGIYLPTSWSFIPSLWSLLQEYFSILSLKSFLSLIISILPPSIIVFLELHGRMIVLEGMLRRDDVSLTYYGISSGSDEFHRRILTKHAVSSVISTILGITPCTFYAQNIAVMNLHNTDLSLKEHAYNDATNFVKQCYNPFSLYPYRIAALLCILASCFTGIQNLLQLIPTPVFGGMELFVFGLVAAPGIQVLVEEQVDYKKISNQIITASVLIAGIGSFSIRLGTYELTGMSLGLFVGVGVNFLSMFLKSTGRLKEKMTFIEILDICLDSCGNQDIEITFTTDEKTIGPRHGKSSELKEYIRENDVEKNLKGVGSVKIKSCQDNSFPIYIWLHGNERSITVWLKEPFSNTFFNDFGSTNNITYKMNGEMDIALEDYITDQLLKQILSHKK